MSIRHPSPQEPSTNNSSAMARCTSASVRQFRHIVDAHRTAEEDLRYQIEGHRAFRRFAELINEAKQIVAKWGTWHFGSERSRGLRRELFEVQIADAERCLENQRTCDDALMVSCTADVARDYLAEAIADYLAQSLSKSQTIDDVICVDRSARRSPR